jgi:hypothetical protein
MGGRQRSLALALVGLALAGCAATSTPLPSLRLVESAPIADSAHRKIAGWQARERAADASAPPNAGTLGADWAQFVAAQRQLLAEQVRAWIQAEARQRYVPDAVMDRWPTSAELFASQGDDCDGLELLALNALRALGFPNDTLFRAVLERPSDGVQHMVTLWFETKEDPFVIDPTGFATERVVSLSALEGWTPRAIFTETAEFRIASPELAPAGAPE